MKVRGTNHVADLHDLRPGQSSRSPTFSVHCNRLNSITATQTGLSRTLSQTSRHVEMVCVRDFRDSCSRLSLRGSFGESWLSRRNGIWALLSLDNFLGIYEMFCNHKNFYIGKQPEPFPGTDTVCFLIIFLRVVFLDCSCH